MTFTYQILSLRIIQLFSRDLKLSIFSNYVEHLKRLVLWYILPLFIILKSPYPISQPAHLEKMILVWGRDYPACKVQQVFEVPTSPSSIRFDDKDYKEPLESNKPGPLEALIRPPKTPIRPLQTLFLISQDPGTNRYSQQDLDKII